MCAQVLKVVSIWKQQLQTTIDNFVTKDLMARGGQKAALQSTARQLTCRDNLHRYALQAKSLQIFNFEVKAGCAEGFSGSPSVEVCTAQGEAFKVSGCSKLLVKTQNMRPQEDCMKT